MEEVIHYLELKNQYYEKFHTVTGKFLKQATDDKWKDIEFFIDNRERILNIIRSFDFKIATLFEGLDMTDTNLDFYRDRVKALLDERAKWAHKIVALDLELISKIDEMKTDTIRALKRVQETSQALDSFDDRPAHAPAARKTA